jgi:zinc transport system permease protein
MLEIFNYEFMIRAMIAGAMIAVVVPALGSFLVARRYALISDSLSHVSLAGIGAGLLLGFSPVIMAIPVAVVGALILEWMRQSKKITGEVSLAILMSGGLALAVVMAGLSGGASGNFSAYLFGSITTTTQLDLILLSLVSAVTLIFIKLNYRALLYISFDESNARVAGHRVTILNYLLVALTALVITLSLRVIGGLLVSALLVLPVVTSSKVCSSFAKTMFLGILFALLSVMLGLLIAFYAGIAAGGAIVLVSIILLVLSLIWAS